MQYIIIHKIIRVICEIRVSQNRLFFLIKAKVAKKIRVPHNATPFCLFTGYWLLVIRKLQILIPIHQ